MKDDAYYTQATKEARWAVALTVFYLLGWCVCAYGFSMEKGWLGFPLWFEFACLYFPLCFTFLIYLCVKFFFRNIELGETNE